MTIKELWELADTEDGTLTYEQFEELARGNKAKFADISEGKYVSINKYNDDLKAKDVQIDNLNGTIQTRETDLNSLQEQLKNAGVDATKLEELSTNLTTLQTKYDTETKELQNKLAKQGYEFAVREFAATKNFSSNAAKRDFINSMINSNLKMSKDGKSIMGAEDFVEEYTQDNADAFITEEDYYTPENDTPDYPLPSFVAPTQGSVDTTPDATGGFADAFHFTTVRPMPET